MLIFSALTALVHVGLKANTAHGFKKLIVPSISMLLNNLLVFCLWIGFFHRFPSVNGWGLPHMAVMFGLGTISFGLIVMLCDGVFELPSIISRGGLDPALLQPKPVLLSLLWGKSDFSGAGEIMTGLLLFWLGWPLIDGKLPALIFFVVTAWVIWMAFGIALGALTLLINRFEDGARSIFYSIIIFATKPGVIYKTGLKWLAFTIMPVAYMTYLPVEYFMQPSLLTVFEVLAGASAALVGSLCLFHYALKNYTSQSRVSTG